VLKWLIICVSKSQDSNPVPTRHCGSHSTYVYDANPNSLWEFCSTSVGHVEIRVWFRFSYRWFRHIDLGLRKRSVRRPRTLNCKRHRKKWGVGGGSRIEAVEKDAESDEDASNFRPLDWLFFMKTSIWKLGGWLCFKNWRVLVSNESGISSDESSPESSREDSQLCDQGQWHGLGLRLQKGTCKWRRSCLVGAFAAQPAKRTWVKKSLKVVN